MHICKLIKHNRALKEYRSLNTYNICTCMCTCMEVAVHVHMCTCVHAVRVCFSELGLFHCCFKDQIPASGIALQMRMQWPG